ncbi:hypothetical protein Tco_0540383 [Tanacetum coccineum]
MEAIAYSVVIIAFNVAPRDLISISGVQQLNSSVHTRLGLRPSKRAHSKLHFVIFSTFANLKHLLYLFEPSFSLTTPAVPLIKVRLDNSYMSFTNHQESLAQQYLQVFVLPDPQNDYGNIRVQFVMKSCKGMQNYGYDNDGEKEIEG